MSFTAYESELDLQLFNQMRDLIESFAEKGNRKSDVRCLFPRRAPSQTMEEQYQLRYPGEVLERYSQRCGDDIKTLRALALALAEERLVLEESMFVDRQKPAFVSKVRACSEGDVYLCGALYMLSEKEVEREAKKQQILKTSLSTMQEAVFACYVLKDEPELWDRLFPAAVKFFGERRNVPAYGNEGIYAFFIDMFADNARMARRTGAEIVKALRELVSHHAKSDGKVWQKLLENGYSEQEIIYLNLTLPQVSNLHNRLRLTSIVMERAAADGCRHLINAESLESEVLYDLCTEYLYTYKRWKVKLEGTRSLSEWLTDRVKLKNVNMFCHLYHSKSELEMPGKWFFVDLSEQHWDMLYEHLGEEYKGLFEENLLYWKQADIKPWLQTYERLAGARYEEVLWKENTYENQRVFKKLVERKEIDIVGLFRQFLEEEKTLGKQQAQKKWNVMLQHIKETGKSLYCHETFRLWEEIDRVYGIKELDTFLGGREVLVDATGFRPFCRSYVCYGERERNDFWRCGALLSVQEQRKLFGWAEDFLYCHMGKYHNSFLYQFLKWTARDLFEKQEVRALAEIVIGSLKPESVRARDLRKEFYEKDEWEAYQKLEEEEREKIREIEERQKYLKWKAAIQEELSNAASTEERFKILGKKAKFLYRSENRYAEIVCSYVDKETRNGRLCATRAGIVSLAEGLLETVRLGFLSWETCVEYIKIMEVQEDELAVDEAAQ